MSARHEVGPDAGSRVVIEGVEKRISPLALGTAFFSLEAKDSCFAILDAFLEEGGTLIDTGRHYGQSEDVLGLWMESRGVRDQIVLLSKGGHGAGHGLPPDLFAPTIERELATSLERLRTDHIDLYALHRDSLEVPVAEIVDCLNAVAAPGRLRTLGASNWEYGRIDQSNAYARDHGLQGFSVVSNNLTLAVPTAPFYPGLVSVDEAGEAWHQRTRIPLVVWSSQARGFFAGRIAPEMRTAAPGAHNRLATRMIEVYGTDDNFERLRRATDLGAAKGRYSATQVALAWLLHRPFPLVPIVGPRNEQEVRSCFQAVSIQLTRREIEWLNLENEGHAAPWTGRNRLDHADI